MATVDIVRRFSGLVGSVQQAAIFGVSEEELGQAATPAANGDVKGRVSSLARNGTRLRWDIKDKDRCLLENVTETLRSKENIHSGFGQSSLSSL